MVLRSVGFDQSGLLQGFLLSGIHDQRSLVSRLKGTAPLQEQVNGPAVLTGFDSDRGRHDGSLLEADIRPGTRSRIARGSKSCQAYARGWCHGGPGRETFRGVITPSDSAGNQARGRPGTTALRARDAGEASGRGQPSMLLRSGSSANSAASRPAAWEDRQVLA